MTAQLNGILAAVVTPFTPEGEVDRAGIAAQVEHILGGGIHGLVPGGSTGEFTTLTLDERKAANRAYVEAAAGRAPVYAGTGALSTTETVELSRDAEAAGADGVMIVPPFYDAPGFEELIAHYGAVSEAIGIPIMYYNIPDATGVELTAEQLGELGRRTGVTCYKDTGGDNVKFNKVLVEQAEHIQALNGWDTLTFQSMALGATAGVWGAASILPRQCADLYEAVGVQGDLARGRELWKTLAPVCEFLESHTYAAAIKAGLRLVGVNPGSMRGPFRDLGEEHLDEFRTLLAAAGAEVTA
ncbi:dihydrodipicolinate synthase family protein [Brevibacterium album]|uniref:dihydrodipicolinate synthase family protein n=1 Tax=Brevibacterium album TaxID=417948 RepID=UPI0003FA7407|nr:dihydrodipicolinate synthase family protein [Brevibacterium album]